MTGSGSEKTFVQFGCGDSAPEGWRNFDASPTLIWERMPVISRLYKKNAEPFPENVEFGDIIKGLPVAAGSCDGVYSSHVLEHMSLENFRIAVANTFKILKPGGVFRLVVPDLRMMAKAYVESNDRNAAEVFVKNMQMGVESEPSGVFSRLVRTFGYTRHLWMWDVPALIEELEKAGFSDIREAKLGDSMFAEFGKVEDPERWDGGAGVEARKPDTASMVH